MEGSKDLLLVDDDKLISSILRKALEAEGYTVRIARYAEDAVDLARERSPQFAVVDLKLPDGSGLALIRQLIGVSPGIRIVMLTGYSSIATAIEAIKLGAHDYLTKPVTADEVIAAFEREPGEPNTAAPLPQRPLSIERMEWEHINRVLSANEGNISATARELGMHRRTLQRKLAKHPVRQ